jgi:hypothetical protein
MTLRRLRPVHLLVALALAGAAVLVATVLAPRASSASSTAIQWQTRCVPSHVANDDPIVFPGQTGLSHTHVFFGNATTDASSTASSLLAAIRNGNRNTSCEDRLDGSAYWVPALYECPPAVTTCTQANGTRVDPDLLFTYFARPAEAAADQIHPFPAGFQMIAGNPAATAAQPLSVIRWRCSSSTTGSSAPPTAAQCPAGNDIIVRITFPNCWDGVLPQGRAFSQHVAYGIGRPCPAAFPQRLPTLWINLRYPNDGQAHSYGLASGSIYSAHADFMDAWEPSEMSRLTTLCLTGTPDPCGVMRTSPTGSQYEAPADLSGGGS